jgi:hypothetical protein
MTAMRERLRRLLIALGLVSAVVMFPALVHADAEPPAADTPPVALNSETDTDAFNLSPVMVVLIASVLIPLVNGVVTKVTTSSAVKAVVTLFLSGVAGLVTVGLTPGGGAVISQQAVIAAAITFITSTATYLGLYKPLGVTSSAKADGTPGALANVGVK